MFHDVHTLTNQSKGFSFWELRYVLRLAVVIQRRIRHGTWYPVKSIRQGGGGSIATTMYCLINQPFIIYTIGWGGINRWPDFVRLLVSFHGPIHFNPIILTISTIKSRWSDLKDSCHSDVNERVYRALVRVGTQHSMGLWQAFLPSLPQSPFPSPHPNDQESQQAIPSPNPPAPLRNKLSKLWAKLYCHWLQVFSTQSTVSSLAAINSCCGCGHLPTFARS